MIAEITFIKEIKSYFNKNKKKLSSDSLKKDLKETFKNFRF